MITIEGTVVSIKDKMGKYGSYISVIIQGSDGESYWMRWTSDKEPLAIGDPIRVSARSATKESKQGSTITFLKNANLLGEGECQHAILERDLGSDIYRCRVCSRAFSTTEPKVKKKEESIKEAKEAFASI